MASKPNLSVVTDSTPKPAKKRLTVAQAAKTGVHRDLLESLRDRVAEQVSDVNCPPRDLAALSRRLQEIAREIDAIDVADAQEANEDAEVADEAYDASAL